MTLFYWIVVTLFGLGLYLAARQFLDLVVDLLSGLAGLIRRRFRLGALRGLLELQRQAGVQPDDNRKSANLLLYSLAQWHPLWIAAAVLAAILLADAMRSPLAFGAILVGGELYRSASRSRRMQRLNEDAGNLIIQFASRYPLVRSLAKALRDASAALPGGEVRRAVEACLARLGMNQKVDEAMQPLRTLNHTVLNRFARLLAGAQDTNQDVFLDTLRILREDVESRLDLHRQARQSLTLVRGTTRVLQAVVVAAMAAVTTLPNWRYYFVSSPKNWLLFVSMLGVAALGSFYVEAELRQVEM